MLIYNFIEIWASFWSSKGCPIKVRGIYFFWKSASILSFYKLIAINSWHTHLFFTIAHLSPLSFRQRICLILFVGFIIVALLLRSRVSNKGTIEVVLLLSVAIFIAFFYSNIVESKEEKNNYYKTK